MDQISVEDLIRTHITLPNRPTTQGWYSVLCKVCNDHGRKGPRGGFKLDGGIIGYHCFNCLAKATHDPSKHRTISKNLEKILLAFNVPEQEINRARLSLLGNKTAPSRQSLQTSNYEPKEIPLPSHFYRAIIIPDVDFLDTSQHQWVEVVRLYLEDRCIDPKSYPFMLSTGVPTDLDKHPKEIHRVLVQAAKKWQGRVIIPIYKDEKLIFYVGRDMTGKKIKKYESPSAPKNNVIFGFDKLFEDTTRPLFVVEGIFDALVVDGVALLGNQLSEGQIYWLNRSNRKKVYIPDRFGDGGANAIKAVDQGWSVAFPDIGQCKDVNEGVEQYGKLYVLASINQNTASGFEARARIGLYCK